MTAELPWYADLREKWRPVRVRLLLVGESAPDPGAFERRFFYAEHLDRRDNLFRGVVAALYGKIPKRSSGKPKAPWLAQLKADGVFLVDLVAFPVDQLAASERRAAREQGVAALVEQARCLDPEGIIVCHTATFKVASGAMRDAGLNVLHSAPLPFPLAPMRARFVSGVRQALSEQPGWKLPT